MPVPLLDLREQYRPLRDEVLAAITRVCDSQQFIGGPVLGADIAIAHAKDLDAEGRFCAAGTGIVPWRECRRLFSEAGYDGPLILHSLREDQVPAAMEAIRA